MHRAGTTEVTKLTGHNDANEPRKGVNPVIKTLKRSKIPYRMPKRRRWVIYPSMRETHQKSTVLTGAASLRNSDL
jgi:hypothetical protein